MFDVLAALKISCYPFVELAVGALWLEWLIRRSAFEDDDVRRIEAFKFMLANAGETSAELFEPRADLAMSFADALPMRKIL